MNVMSRRPVSTYTIDNLKNGLLSRCFLTSRNLSSAVKFQDFTEWYAKRGTNEDFKWRTDKNTLGHTMAKVSPEKNQILLHDSDRSSPYT